MLIPRIILKKNRYKCIRIVPSVKPASLIVIETFYIDDTVMNINPPK